MSKPIPGAGAAGTNRYRVRQLIGTNLVNQVAEITRDFNEQTDTVVNATLPGDSRRLRGIPVVGEGVAGAMFGTRPDREAERMDAA